MSEFSALTTKLVTPVLRERGFKKHGSFTRGSIYDFAIYRRGDLEVKLTYAFGSQDYPDIGIRLRVCDGDKVRFEKLYDPIDDGTEAIFRILLNDIEAGKCGMH